MSEQTYKHPTGTTTRRLPGSYTSRKKADAAVSALADKYPQHLYEVRELGQRVRPTYYVVCTTSPSYR
jgi:hypothetical protein